jgi:hypothetical protein
MTTILKLETKHRAVQIELKDGGSMPELVSAFVAACIGVTYQKETVMEALAAAYDEYKDAQIMKEGAY